MADDARRRDDGADVSGAADDMVAADRRSHPVDAFNAVLNRNDDGGWTKERAKLLNRGIDVVELDREEDEIDRADRGRVVGRLHARQGQIVAKALDPEPVGAQGGEVRATRDEVDVGAGRA